MRKLFSTLLFCFPVLLAAQVADSVSLKMLDSLKVLSRKFTNESDFDKALEVNAAAEKLALEKWGRESAGYGSACDNHGWILAYKGSFQEAENWYLEAKDIQKKVLGAGHPDYAVTLNDLAVLYSAMGNYALAEPLFLEARSIWEKALGKENGYAAWSAESMGTMYHRMNNYEKAEALYAEANRIRAKTLGKQHPYYAITLRSQASLCIQLRQYKKAETLYLEAKDIQEKTLGNLSAEYAHTLDGLAVLYDDYLKDAKKAETYYLEVKSIREKTLGKTHPDYGWSLGNLGNFYWYTGNYQAAEPLFLEVTALWEKTLGKTHPSYVWTLHKLWALYWSLGNYPKAEQYGSAMNESEKNQLLQAARYLSAEELSAYIRKFQDGLDEGFSFANVQAGTAGSCYDNLLFYKGFLLNAIVQFQSLALADTANAAKFEALKSCERRLAAEYAQLPADQKNVPELREQINTLEKELTRSVAGFGSTLRQVNWQEVQQTLKPGEAAIEFVHYKFVDPRPTNRILYAALVLLPGTKLPRFVPLFEEKQLEAILETKGKTKVEHINALYASTPENSLYNLVWKPLEQEISGIKTIYFSPSGLLHRLNIGAIPDAGLPQGTLAGHYHLVELGSTRQLVISTEVKPGGSAPLLYGGIRYDLDNLSEGRGGKWNYLKWTDVEVSATAVLLEDSGLHPVVRKNYEASEEYFKSIGAGRPSPRILHLATHGFFFPDPKTATQDPQAAEGNESGFKRSDQPMMRSGVILAGGNYAWQHGRPFRPELEDGIVTAYEISQMNLSNTELVVLSACETGLGDIQGNEGVYGLQRAFKIAGAKYLIMSLWQVPDFQTQELMTTFYSRWIEDKLPIPDAFSSAQKTMREKYKDPFLWAGFVLVE